MDTCGRDVRVQVAEGVHTLDCDGTSTAHLEADHVHEREPEAEVRSGSRTTYTPGGRLVYPLGYRYGAGPWSFQRTRWTM